MHARNRLLIFFLSVSLFGLIFAVYISYNSSIKSKTNSEQRMLQDFSEHIITMLKKQNNSFDNTEAIRK